MIILIRLIVRWLRRSRSRRQAAHVGFGTALPAARPDRKG